MKLGWSILAMALVLGQGGCSVYDYRYVFEPDPQVAETPVDGGSLKFRVSVLGLRESPGDPGPVVAVRVQVENASQTPIDFEPATLVLRAGDGTPFGDPIPQPAGRQAIAPGATAMVEAAFPLPAAAEDVRDVDWSALSVEWTVQDGAPARVAADFTREPRAYYDRYPNRIGVGFMRFDTK